MKMNVLVTGAAGFIGYYVVKRLLQEQDINVVGIDNLNDYYDVNLKYARLEQCGINTRNISSDSLQNSTTDPNYRFIRLDISDYPNLDTLFRNEKFDIVINMAAQAGVKYSTENPAAYVQSNLVGFANILECCRHHHIKHLVYASSSSVYGTNNEIPFAEEDRVDYPVSFYAATKKSNELMAYSYSHLFQLPTTGVRLFTVYGPWGRPDMAPMLFAKSIYEGKIIKIFNQGDMLRDFTYVENTVESIIRVMDNIPTKGEEHPYYRILNIGNSQPVNLLDFVKTIERAIGIKAKVELLPMLPSDVKETAADTSKLVALVNYKPATDLDVGIERFISWYKEYYK